MLKIINNTNLYQIKQPGYNSNTSLKPLQRNNTDNFIKKLRAEISFTAIKPEETSPERPIVIITDTWEPHICGVTRGTKKIAEALKAMNYHVKMITPNDLPGIKPKFIENGTLKITISPGNKKRLQKMLAEINPVGAYIVTEGPIGITAVREFKEIDEPFTSSYLTKWPELFSSLWRESLSKIGLIKDKDQKGPFSRAIEKSTLKILRWFHNSANTTLVTAASMRDYLKENGFTKIEKWSRAVDTEIFKPDYRKPDGDFIFKDPVTGKTASSEGGKYKILGYIGRISPDKNINAILNLAKNKDKTINNGNYKVVVVGPTNTLIDFDDLREEYPDVIFTGPKKASELPEYYANFDAFIFPGLKDTFGIVQLEALACGTPVVAYDVNGPKDIIKDGKVGILEKNIHNSLNDSIKKALELDRSDCREYIINTPSFNWAQAAKDLAKNIDKISNNAFNRR